jgi:hypothetical protein
LAIRLNKLNVIEVLSKYDNLFPNNTINEVSKALAVNNHDLANRIIRKSQCNRM